MSKFLAVALIVEIDDDTTDGFDRLESIVSQEFCPTHNDPADYGSQCRITSLASTVVSTAEQAYQWMEA